MASGPVNKNCPSHSGLCISKKYTVIRTESCIGNRKRTEKIPKVYPNKLLSAANTGKHRRQTSREKIVRRTSHLPPPSVATPQIQSNQVHEIENVVPEEQTESATELTITDICHIGTIDKPMKSPSNLQIEKRSKKKLRRRCYSLMNLEKFRNMDSFALHSPFTEQMLSVRPGSLNFDFIDSSSTTENYIDFLQEFDFIRNGLFDRISKYKNVSESEKEIFSLVPKLTAASSSPLILKRKATGWGVLSLKDSPEEKNGKDSNVSTANKEMENGSNCCSSADSDDVGNERLLFSDSVLRVKKPVKMKYTDEVSKMVKEMVIYSDEFLASLKKEKGRLPSRKEVLESLLEESTEYKGASLRAITNAKSFFKNRKSQGDAASLLGNSLTPSRVSRKEIRANSQPMTVSRKTWERFSSKEHVNRWNRLSEQKVPQTKNVRKDSVEVKGADKRRTYANGSNMHFLKKSKLKRIPNPVVKEGKRNGEKSRTSVKRVNIDEITSSDFSDYFHFYAKLGPRTKCGAAISKMNSLHWLKSCGLIDDQDSKDMAESCFLEMAKTMSMLNIRDYVHYLIKLARKKRMILVDVINQLKFSDSCKAVKVKYFVNQGNLAPNPPVSGAMLLETAEVVE